MKILHCITSLHPDGAQQMLLRLVQSLDRSLFQHTLVSLRERLPFAQEFEAHGVKVICLDMHPKLPRPGMIRQFRRIVREEKPDLVQSWLYHANCLAAIALRGFNPPVPLIWAIRGSLEGTVGRGLITTLVIKFSALLSHRPNVITFNSKSSISDHQRIGYRCADMRYLGNGFDVSRFVANPRFRAGLRSRLGLSESDLVVGTAGRYDPTKDYPTFVRAFAVVAAQLPHARAIMVGRGVDSENRELAQLIAEQGLERRIILLGRQEDMAQVYPAFDVFCLSSVTEGFPNVLAEALACELPCVVTRVGMAPELVEDAGIVVPRASQQELAGGLLSLLQLPAGERSALGRRGRKRICEEFQMSAIADKHQELYLEVARHT